MSDKKTKVFRETFNGHKILAIWEVDPCGNKVGKSPVISFGLNKAKEIWDNRVEVKKFLSENGYKTEE